MTDTTSWFHDQGERVAPNVIRRFIVGSDDYSDRVLKWPVISTDYKRVRPGKVSIRLANHDQALNSFTNDKTNLIKTCLLQFGYPAEGGDFKESAMLPRIEPSESSFVGLCVSMTGSGDFAAVGVTGSNSQSVGGGAVEIYKRHPSRWKDKLGDKWNLHQAIYDPTCSNNHYFGAMHDFSSDGQYLFIGQQRHNGSVGSQGIVYAYEYINSIANPDVLNGAGIFSGVIDPTEIVRNGQFTDNASYWLQRDVPLAVESQQLKISVGSTGAFQFATQVLNLTPGNRYTMEVQRTFKSVTSGSGMLGIMTDNGFGSVTWWGATKPNSLNISDTITGLDHSTLLFLGTSTTSANEYTKWDDVSVKETHEMLDSANFQNTLIGDWFNGHALWKPVFSIFESNTVSPIVTITSEHLHITHEESTTWIGAWQVILTNIGSAYSLETLINSGSASNTVVGAHSNSSNPGGNPNLLKLTGVNTYGLFGRFVATTSETFIWVNDGQVGSGSSAFIDYVKVQNTPNDFITSNIGWETREADRLRVRNGVSFAGSGTNGGVINYVIVDSGGGKYIYSGRSHYGTATKHKIQIADWPSGSLFEREFTYTGSEEYADWELEFTFAESGGYVRMINADASPGIGDYTEYSNLQLRKVSDRYVEVASIFTTAPSTYANFGHSVSTNYDGTKVVIGAPRYTTDVSTGPVGAAFIYVHSDNNTWNEVQKLDDIVTISSGDRFGEVVKINGVGDRIAVAAPFDGVAIPFDGSKGGALHWFVESSNGYWGNPTSIIFGGSTNTGFNNFFQSKTIDMDYEGTGLLIGGPLSLSGRGKVLQFAMTESSFTSKGDILKPNVTSGDTSRFGSSVFLSDSGDVAILSGDSTDTSREDTGEVYVLRRSSVTSNYEHISRYVPNEIKRYGEFGFTYFGFILHASKYGDTFIAGAPNYFNTAADQGRAFIYVSSTITASYSPEEVLDIYKGHIDDLDFGVNNTVKFSLQDRMKLLKEIYMGTEDDPIIFTNSTLPSDIAWTACTCYGGLSSIESTSNPDIDYTTFDDWATRMGNDSLFMNGELKGVRAIEVLGKVARLTDSSITVENDKIFFRRWSAAESITQDFNIDNSDLALRLAPRDMINNQTVTGAYDVENREYGVEINVTDQPSVNSFGIKEHSEKDTSLWFVSSTSCVNLGQRKVVFNKEPTENIRIGTYLPGLSRHLGDTISTTNSAHNHNEFLSRVTGRIIDMDAGKIQLRSSPSILLAGFVLDVDSLDTTNKFLT